MSVFLLILVGCGDLVKSSLFESELDNRDLRINGLESRMSALEETVSTQTETIATQQAAIVDQQTTIESQQAIIDVLQSIVSDDTTRIDTIETSINDGNVGLLARMTTAETDIVYISSALAGHDAQLATLTSDITTLDSRTDVIDANFLNLSNTIMILNTSVSGNISDIASLQADIASIQVSGGDHLWSDEGLGSGICARANVTAINAGPLYVFATVEASGSYSGGCSASTGCVTPTSSPTSINGTVTINAENSAGTWSDSVSTTSSLMGGYTPANLSSFWGGPYYSGYSYFSQSWTVPLQTVLDIPAAGDYIIDLDVTDLTGVCRITVMQP